MQIISRAARRCKVQGTIFAALRFDRRGIRLVRLVVEATGWDATVIGSIHRALRLPCRATVASIDTCLDQLDAQISTLEDARAALRARTLITMPRAPTTHAGLAWRGRKRARRPTRRSPGQRARPLAPPAAEAAADRGRRVKGTCNGQDQDHRASWAAGDDGATHTL